jgi:hypothetical protein
MLLDLAETGVRLKLLGDSHQIQPIDQSSDARVVMDRAAKYGAAELAKSYRCEKWADLHGHLRRAVVGDGPVSRAVRRMSIREAATVEEIVAIAEEMGGEIAAQTNSLRVEIAEALPRPEMPLDPEGEPVIAMLRDGIAGWEGDQIVVRSNVWQAFGDRNKQIVSTGQKGLIKSVSGGQIVVEIGGRSVILSKDRARSVLALGGVQTGDSAQGQTWERAIVVLSGTESREWLYSAATRGVEAPIFVVKTEDGEGADPRSVLKTVLERAGMAQTTEEMALDDERLAASIAESEAGWMPPQSSAPEPEPEDDEKVESRAKVAKEPEAVVEPEVQAKDNRSFLITAIATDSEFRSEKEVDDQRARFEQAWRDYDREVAVLRKSKEKLNAALDHEYVVYETRKLAAMKDRVREEGMAVKDAMAVRRGLLGPLSESEREAVEALRDEKVEAARRVRRIEDDDRPYRRGESKDKSETVKEPEPMPEAAKDIPAPKPEPEPPAPSGGFGRRRR